ncbi:CCL4 protein, partial [Cettia cetti]|nr:CCL4 protein [Cettia cetti]
MRVLAAALAVLLLVAICSLARADAGLSKNETKPISCCYTSISSPIPRSMIHSAYRTSSSCPAQAVVLVTKKGKKVCADPKARWVQKYLKRLELLEY